MCLILGSDSCAPHLHAQISVLEAAAAQAQAAASAAGDGAQAAQRLQQLSATAARKEAALQEARQSVARLQRWVAGRSI